MTPDAVKASYRRMLDDVGEMILIRRYTGQGTARPRFSVEVKARVTGYDPDELVGTVQQGDRKVIVLVQDLIDAQFALPIVKGDKVVVRGKEMNVESADDSTRRLGIVSVAFELQARG